MTKPDEDLEATRGSTVRGSGYQRTAARLLTRSEPRLVFGEVLGKGAMGIVHAAEQTALGRLVAVKAPRSAQIEDVGSVLQEAWVGGLLEHPNIVPVYDIEVIDDVPHVVMKKIDGEPWSNFVDDPARIRSTFSRPDALGWNLEVLVAVCNAVEFAHDRGILHRDLKPSNVMIGRFGEVWVVDWGLAVSLLSEHANRLPLAADQQDAAGTPCYMAPEMARGEALTVRTDVYLLGALLYRIVTGDPLRRGGRMEQVYKAAFEPPSIDRNWPLSHVLASALTTDPAARPESVGVFRAQVQAFLAQRGHQAVLISAQGKLSALEQEVQREGGPDHRVQVYDLFSACRFGFEEARSELGPIEVVTEGLRDATLWVARYEIDRGDERAAGLLLAPLQDVPGELTAALQTLRDRRSATRARLDRLEADVSPRTAAWARIAVLSVMGTVWAVTPGVVVLSGWADGGYPRELGIAGGTFAITVSLMVVFAPWLVRSRLNRVIVALAAIAPGLAFILNVGGWMRGLPSDITGTIELFVYFTAALMASILADWRLFVGAFAYLVAYLLAMWDPGSTLFWMNVANVILALNGLFIWIPLLWSDEAAFDRPLF